MQAEVHTPSVPRTRRSRSGIRLALLESALVEFGAKGYDGASTRSIARRIDAHQPQINYHFESKAALWTAAVDHLFALLTAELDGIFPNGPASIARMPALDDGLGEGIADGRAQGLADGFAEGIRRLVRFAAAHPELNQIMVHEATAPSDRLSWMTETHVRPIFEAACAAWELLRDAGVAAPIESDVLYYVLVGAASLPYVNAAEVRLLTGRDPSQPDWIEAHAASLIAVLLPGMTTLRLGVEAAPRLLSPRAGDPDRFGRRQSP